MQNTTMTEKPACSTSDRLAETGRPNAAGKNSVLTPIEPIALRESAGVARVELLKYLDQYKIGTRLLFANSPL